MSKNHRKRRRRAQAKVRASRKLSFKNKLDFPNPLKKYKEFLKRMVKRNKQKSPVPSKVLDAFNLAFTNNRVTDDGMSIFYSILGSYGKTLNDYDDIAKLRALLSLFSKFINVEDRIYKIVGYGSLINVRSRARTTKGKVPHCPVDIAGWTRIFNLRHGSKGGTVLNVIQDENSKIASVLIEIQGKNMFDVLSREYNYNMVEIPLDKITFPYGESLHLSNPPLMFVSNMEPSKEPPLEEYLQACIFGSSQISEKFVENFINSSYIYDMSPLRDYMKTTYGDVKSEQFKKTDSKY